MKWWTKTKEFCKRYKTAIVATMTGIGGAVGGVWLYRKLSGNSEDDAIDWQPLPEIEPVAEDVSEEDDDLSWADPMYRTIIDYEKKAEEGENIWLEKPHWRDGWNKVEALANEIDPYPGEYYVIEGANPDCNDDHATWFIHHWDEDRPAYPTELVTVQKEE